MNTRINRRYFLGRHQLAGFGIASLLALSACAPVPGLYQSRRAGNAQAGANQQQNRDTGNAQAGTNQQQNRTTVNVTAQSSIGQPQNRGNGRGMGGPQRDMTTVDAGGNTHIQGAALSTTLNAMPKGTLSEADAAGLLFMREEEKLAQDVYQVLATKWSLPIFSNIAQSEQTHTNAIKLLLDRYELNDPANEKAVGQFSNATLQKLYDDLIAQGSQSLAEALRVGATIEDLDITDLDKRQSSLPDIQLVYDNLTKGSRNHLRAFTTQLKNQADIDYQPQFLSEADYIAIITAAMERGPAQ